MQRKYKIFLVFILVILTNLSQHIVAQDVGESLVQADSSYSNKKYKEAEKTYLKLLFEEQRYTPAMLLKIVQLNEMKPKPHFVQSLYALSLYYSQIPDSRVLEKIEEIADKEQLKGYQTTDLEYVVYFYNQYKLVITILSILLFTGGVIYLFYRKKEGKNPIFRAIILTVIMAVFFWIHNHGLTYQKGILSQEALLMNAPSAGAKCVGVISEGDCFQIIDKQDVWYKVRDKKEGKEGYIRQNNFLVIK